MGIVLMENVDSGKQADIEATMIGYATPLFEEAKAKKEDPAFCFLTGKSAGGICDRVRELVKAGAANDKPQMFLLDIPDNGGYYVSPAEDITADSLCFRRSLQEQGTRAPAAFVKMKIVMW